MKAAIHWLNRYLAPGDLTPQSAEDILTGASFPIDAREALPGGNARLEVEVTSNRGDCLSHYGLAREIAARTGRALSLPMVPDVPRAGSTRDFISLDNQVPDLCPRFTLQVIRGVKVGPSPAWLREALESVGQRSINNIVDITNFINFELGHPCHAFDLARLAPPEPKLIIRLAHKGEQLTTLDGKKRTLAGDEVVVADAQRAQSLAGVIGGGDSEVSDRTTDIALELATWDPVAVRRAARRHQVRTDAGHRFERYVDPRTLDYPAARAAALVIEVAGGQLAGDMLDQGAPPAPAHTISLRPDRCRAVIGAKIADQQIARILTALEIAVSPQASSPSAIVCTPPAFRPDLTREIDLIEEVARMHGLENIPIHPRMNVEVRHPQESELKVREIARILTGLGFHETVTFSFIAREHAAAFITSAEDIIAVDDERRKHEPALRPSIIPGLLASRRANQNAGVQLDGGIRLFELAATFARDSGPSSTPAGSHSSGGTVVPGIHERRKLSLLIDVPGAAKGKPASVDQQQTALRILRGAIEAIVASLTGRAIDITPADPRIAALDPATCGQITLDGQALGTLGLLTPAAQTLFNLDIPQAAAEIDLQTLLSFPAPSRHSHVLPSFPPIERDLSLIVGEEVRWQQLRTLVEHAKLEKLEEVAFVASYRGKQTGPGRKSLTMRLRFRDPARTLRHDEVDPQIAAIVDLASRELQASLRA
jgi:phenylalanyl-tRNA synthetase beta chain